VSSDIVTATSFFVYVVTLLLELFHRDVNKLLRFGRGTGGETGISQSVERLATGWTVRGSNPGGGEIFRIHPDQPGAHPASCTVGTGPVLGLGVNHPTLFSAEAKERVELCFCSPSVPSWHVIG
jgi:hypothetical protein